MGHLDEIELRIQALERKCNCKILSYNPDKPGKEGVLYIDYNTGAIYVWNGSQYILYSDSQTFLERQAFEPYYDNPPIPLTVDAVQFERYLDAKYMYIESTGEHRIYFLCIPSLVGLHQYRYAFSNDGGKTWDFNPATPHYFQALGSGDEIGLHEHFIFQLDANNWRMYYQAYDITGKYRTKLATSTDGGLTWTRQGVVLDVGGTGAWDSNYAGFRNVIQLPDGTFYAAYEGHSGGVMSAGAAKSVDGLTWTKIGQIFEMEPATYPWEGNAGLINYVQYIDGVFVMMYGTKQLTSTIQNTNRYIGLAYSADGVNYQKYQANPIINLSDYMVNVPGSWNYGTEDFIAWDLVPGKEGAYTIITRGRPVYPGSGPQNWNFGLYWFGNRINSDDIMDASITDKVLTLVKKLGKDITVDLALGLNTDVEKVWYVNPNGDNVTVQVGNIFRPAADPYFLANLAQDFDTIELNRGTYQANTSLPFNNSDWSDHSIIKVENLLIKADKHTTFEAPVNSNQNGWFANDIVTFGNSVGKRNLTIKGKPNLFGLRNGAGIIAPLLLYNAEGILDIELGKVDVSGGGRNWLIQTGCDTINLHIDDYYTSGTPCFWYTTNVGGTPVKKNVNVTILNGVMDGNNDRSNGFIRMNAVDIATPGNYNYNIGNLVSTGVHDNAYMFSMAGSMGNSTVNYKINKFQQLLAKTFYDSYAAVSIDGGGDACFSFQGTYYNSHIYIEIDNIETPNTFFGTFLTSLGVLDNSVLHIKIKRGVFTGSAPFLIKRLELINGSKVIIDCDECLMLNSQSAFWIYDNTMDDNSTIEIRGKYRCFTDSGLGTTTSVPVINTRNRIMLNDCILINADGTPPVDSDGAVNVLIKDTYSKSTTVSGNVTELVENIVRDINIL